jgi:hypothetical protein
MKNATMLETPGFCKLSNYQQLQLFSASGIATKQYY